MTKKTVFLILLISSLFISCSSIFSPKKKVSSADEIVISGKLSSIYTDSSQKQNNRSAYPETTGIDLFYKLQAVDSDNEEDVVNAVISDNNFTIALKDGKIWNLTAICYYHDDVYDTDVEVLKTTKELDLTESPASINNLELPLDEIVSGPSCIGQIKLPVSVESNLIKKCVIKYKESNVSDYDPYDVTTLDFSADKNQSFIMQNTCGLHDLELRFYMNDSAGNEVLCFSINESVCVLNGLVTEKWNSSQSEYINNNKIYITDLLVQQFKSKYFYVSDTGDDTNGGTFQTPFKTLQKAANVIEAVNDGTSVYNIFVISDISASNLDFEPAANDQSLADFNPVDKNLKINISSYPASATYNIELNGRGRAFSFNNRVFSTISRLNFNNGDSDAGVIYSKAKSLSIKNCIFSDSYSINCGGAIDASEDCKVVCESVTFSKIDSANYGADISLRDKASLELKKCIFIPSDIVNYGQIINGIPRGNINQQGTDGQIIFDSENTFTGSIYTENPIILKNNLGTNFLSVVYLPSTSDKSVYFGNNVQLLKNVGATDYVSTEFSKFLFNQTGYVIDSTGLIKQKGYIFTSSLADLSGAPAANAVYSISTPEEMKKLSEITNSYSCENSTFVLTENIDLFDISPFSPIGKVKQFKGIFDGNNKLITNLNVVETTEYAGLFARTSDAIIKNVKLNGSVTGTASTGGLVGNLNYYKNDDVYCIENCIVNVTVTSTSGTSAGGIIGKCSSNKYVKIINCINLGSVSCTSGNVGGIEGTGYGKIINSANLGDVLSGTSAIGGIFGGGAIESDNCYSSAHFNTGVTITGGFGGTTGSESIFSNDYFFEQEIAYPLCNSQNSSAINKLQTAESSSLGSKLNSSLQQGYKEWLYSYSKEGVDYPVCLEIPPELLIIKPVVSAPEDSVLYLIQKGLSPEVGTTYSISSKEELIQIASWVNDGNDLANVTFSQTETITLVDEFIPIGNSATRAFKGSYHGNNKSITGLNVNLGSNTNGGLFGYTDGAYIENLYVEGSVEAGGWTGGIVGYADGGTLISECVSNVSITGNGTGIGGIVGYSNDSYVQKSVNIGSVNCNNTTSSQIGGIIGAGNDSTMVEYCVNFGNIHGNANAGGIIGFATDANFTISGSYNAGKITANNSQKCGSIYGKKDFDNNAIQNCYSIKQSCSQEISENTSGFFADEIVKVVTLNELQTELTDSNWLDNFHSYPVPVSFIPLSIDLPFTPSVQNGNHMVLDESYKSVSSFNSSIPVSGDKVKISSDADFSTLLKWSYDSNTKQTNSLEGVKIVLNGYIDMKNVTYYVGPGVNNNATTYDSSAFKGEFDGNGYIIENVVLGTAGSGWHGCGIIGVAGEGAVIKNIHLKNVKLYEPITKCGGIVGYVKGQNVLIENCIVEDIDFDLNAKARGGGIVGFVELGASVTVRNCITTGSIKGQSGLGGIVGGDQNTSGTIVIENSASYCSIENTNGISGGIVAKTSDSSSKIYNCFFGGKITRTSGSGQLGPIANVLYGSSSEVNNYKNLFYEENWMDAQNANTTFTQTVPTGVSILPYKITEGKYIINSIGNDVMEVLNSWVDEKNLTGGNYKSWIYKEGKLLFE